MNTTLQSDIFQVSHEIHWEDAAPGIQRQVYGYNESIMLVKVKFEKGAIGVLHQHKHSQISYVESGVFELNIGDKKKILKKGDGYYVPPNSIHGCICIEQGMLVDVFSPFREEFLK